jgi:Tfp pilus assembly protein PilO
MSTQVRERISKSGTISKRVARRPLGLSPVEMVVASLTLIVFAFVVVYYLMYLAPEQDKVNELEQQDKEQQSLITDFTPKPAAQTAPPADEGKEAKDSLDTFKEKYLLDRRATESRLRDLINKQAAKHGLQIVAGIPMNEKRIDQAKQGESNRVSEQEALERFPSLETDFSVAGEYPKLRAFIKDLESSNLFVLLSAVSLTSREDKEAEPRARLTSGIQLTIKLSVPFKE